MPVEKSAGAVVFCRESDGKIKYLLLARAGERGLGWGFSKGLIEKGEKLEAAALREVKEETGLADLEFVSGFKETIRYFMKAKYDYQVKERGFKMGEKVLKFATYFLVEAKDKNVGISFEHEGYEWLEFGEAMERLKKYKNSQEVLEKADKFLDDK